MAMMTVLRVLPDELYDKVVSGKGDIEPGASVPGSGPGKMMKHGDHDMHDMHDMENMENMEKSDSAHPSDHAGHTMEQKESQPQEQSPHHHHD